jgi:hypothetical protein
MMPASYTSSPMQVGVHTVLVIFVPLELICRMWVRVPLMLVLRFSREDFINLSLVLLHLYIQLKPLAQMQ